MISASDDSSEWPSASGAASTESALASDGAESVAHPIGFSLEAVESLRRASSSGGKSASEASSASKVDCISGATATEARLVLNRDGKLKHPPPPLNFFRTNDKSSSLSMRLVSEDFNCT